MPYRRAQLFAAAAVLGMISAPLPSIAQTGGNAPAAPGAPAPGIGLTPDHKRTIYSEVGQEPPRPIPEGSPVAIGAEIPDSLMLNEMPVSVKDKIGVLRDFKFAKLPDETIVIVDPAKRRIVDIVSKSDGTP
jgi:hypothetical protein